MAFKGLSDRFNAKVKQLYHENGTLQESGVGGRSDQPYVEWTPDDPNARQESDASRMSPGGALSRDIARIGKFSKSNKGLLFLLNQELLQSANTFSETRVINPLFVISNAADPIAHVRRPLTFASEFAVTGDTSTMSPGSDSLIQSAGRLQKATADDAIARVVGNSGPAGLLSLLPSNIITNTISTVLAIKELGIEGINQRPELNVNGQYYSVLLWEGFTKRRSVSDNLNSALANLRSGNIQGAINSLNQAGQSAISAVTGNAPLVLQNRDTTSTDADGTRYFITDANNADRYIRDSITFTVDNHPHAHTPGLNHKPDLPTRHDIVSIPLPTFTTLQPPLFRFNLPFASAVQSAVGATAGIIGDIAGAVDSFTHAVGNTLSNVAKAITSPLRGLVQINTSKTDFTQLFINQAKAALTTPINPKSNPGEASMLFPDLALQQRYLADAGQAIRSAIGAQQQNQQDYWNKTKPEWPSQRGFISPSGYNAGDTIIDPESKTKMSRQPGGYLKDNLNSIGTLGSTGDTSVSDTDIQQLMSLGQDLIMIHFFDTVNKIIVPFRAYLTNLMESVNPEFSDTRYIGRLERNVVYTGVSRELSFQLRVHAMSDSEMGNIWQKLNYLTGMCYPSKYDPNGFMVPPLVKLTIGDFYRDQPGYIRGLQNSVEEGTSWEVTPGNQVPYGMTMNVSFAVLEKRAMETNEIFYEFGQPRSLTNVTPIQVVPTVSQVDIPTIPSISNLSTITDV